MRHIPLQTRLHQQQGSSDLLRSPGLSPVSSHAEEAWWHRISWKEFFVAAVYSVSLDLSDDCVDLPFALLSKSPECLAVRDA